MEPQPWSHSQACIVYETVTKAPFLDAAKGRASPTFAFHRHSSVCISIYIEKNSITST